MQTLMRDQFLGILRMTSGAFDQLQHAGHVALAFGTPTPAAPGRYLDLDLVGMATSLGLAASLGRSTATAGAEAMDKAAGGQLERPPTLASLRAGRNLESRPENRRMIDDNILYFR